VSVEFGGHALGARCVSGTSDGSSRTTDKGALHLWPSFGREMKMADERPYEFGEFSDFF